MYFNPFSLQLGKLRLRCGRSCCCYPSVTQSQNWYSSCPEFLTLNASLTASLEARQEQGILVGRAQALDNYLAQDHKEEAMTEISQESRAPDTQDDPSPYPRRLILAGSGGKLGSGGLHIPEFSHRYSANTWLYANKQKRDLPSPHRAYILLGKRC